MRKIYDEYLEDQKLIRTSKENISEKRKYFADLLKKREEEVKQARQSEDDDAEIVNSYMMKKRMSKNVEKIYENVGQKEVNEILEGQRKNKEELKKMLSTIKVKIVSNDSKQYTRVLLKMIFNRFGTINDITYDKINNKSFIQYNDVLSADNAKNYFDDRSDFRIKYLITENRDKCIEKLADISSSFDVSSENINKISATYNGYSYDQRKKQLDREVERQREIRRMLNDTHSSKPTTNSTTVSSKNIIYDDEVL